MKITIFALLMIYFVSVFGLVCNAEANLQDTAASGGAVGIRLGGTGGVYNPPAEITTEETTEEAAWETGTSEITLDIIDFGILNLCYLQFSPLNKPIEDLILNENAFVVTSNYKYIICDIEWDDFSAVDTSSPGRKLLAGRVIPPEGYTFGAKEIYVYAPIIIYDENAEGTEEIIPPDDINCGLITPGADITTYLEKYGSCGIYTVSGDFFKCEVQWEDINSFSETGPKTVRGTLNLPKGIKISDENDAHIDMTFYVMKDDKIYLDYYTTQLGGDVVYRWIYETEGKDVEVYVSNDNETYRLSDYDFCLINGSSFKIYMNLLEDNTDYYFRLKYNDEYTDTIKINKTSGEIIILGGDRDGGDNDKQEVPSIIQDAQTKTEGENAESSQNKKTSDKSSKYSRNIKSADEEADEKDSTTVSGKRLEDLAEDNNGKIPFEKNDIEIILDNSFIEDNDIQSDDTVIAEIKREADNRFSVDITVNDKSVTEIPKTEVFIYPSDGIGINEEVPSHTIDETGSYVIEENEAITYEPVEDNGSLDKKENTNNKNHKNNKFFIPICAALLLGICFCTWKGYKNDKTKP